MFARRSRIHAISRDNENRPAKWAAIQFHLRSDYNIAPKSNPSGGYIRYVWQLVQQSSYNVFTGQATQNPGPNCEEIYASYALQNRYVSFNGTTEALEQDFSYTSTWTTNGWEYWTNKQTTVTTKDNVRGTSYATVYSYTPFYQPAQPNDLSVVEPVAHRMKLPKLITSMTDKRFPACHPRLSMMKPTTAAATTCAGMPQPKPSSVWAAPVRLRPTRMTRLGSC